MRGRAPLYGLVSTKNVTGSKVTLSTKGNSEGFNSMTLKAGTNFGGIQVVTYPDGTFEIKLIPWKDETGQYRGVNKLVLKGNFDKYDETQKEQMPLFEHLAHQEYADNQ